jgi:hypothetical protein
VVVQPCLCAAAGAASPALRHPASHHHAPADPAFALLLPRPAAHPTTPPCRRLRQPHRPQQGLPRHLQERRPLRHGQVRAACWPAGALLDVAAERYPLPAAPDARQAADGCHAPGRPQLPLLLPGQRVLEQALVVCAWLISGWALADACPAGDCDE